MTQERTPQVDRQTIRIFWSAGMRYKKLLLAGLLFPVGTILQNVVAPLFLGKTLGALALPHGDPAHYLVYFAIASFLGITCNRIGHPAVVSQQAYGMRDIQKLALTTLLRRSVGFHNDNISGKLVSDATDYPSSYGDLHNTVIGTMLPFGITLIFGSAIIYSEAWVLGLFITFMTVTIVGLGFWDSKRMLPERRRRLIAGKTVTAHLADTITNIQTVKTFANERQELDQHEAYAKKLLDIRLDNWFHMSRNGNRRIVILAVLQTLFALTTIWLVRRDPSLLGVGIFAFTFTIMLSNRLFEVNMLFRLTDEALLRASPMTAIILEEPEINDKPGAPALQIEKGRVELKNLTFSYHDSHQDNTVFSELNLSIKPGEKIGLVGPSGGGKSTLTRLLLRFEEIANGTISIDGQNIADITQDSLRQNISYVPQEPLLFHRSVHENISYGLPGASIEMIEKAAKMAHAHDFIVKLKDQYDTVVGERGVKLSGGQRQRIAIARAILKNAPILILDEATSALDSESEVLIQDALWKLMEGRTAIVIAHRLSTIQKMDRIIVLEDGTITEEGTHKQLLKHNGTYAKLWGHQSGGFIVDDKTNS